MNTKYEILKFIKEKGQTRAEDLNQKLNVSRVTIHKQLRRLLGEGSISKSGRPPKVFYQLKEKQISLDKNIDLKLKTIDFIEKN